MDALRDLDDALSTVGLFAQLPAGAGLMNTYERETKEIARNELKEEEEEEKKTRVRRVFLFWEIDREMRSSEFRNIEKSVLDLDIRKFCSSVGLCRWRFLLFCFIFFCFCSYYYYYYHHHIPCAVERSCANVWWPNGSSTSPPIACSRR